MERLLKRGDMMFFRIIRLIFGIATFFLFVACGGSSENSSKSSSTSILEKISNRDVVSINYHYSSEICSSSDFKNYMKNTLSFGKDFIFSVENNNITCQTYGKVNNGNECYEGESNDGYNTSCVVALNIKNNTYSKKILKKSNSFIAKDFVTFINEY